MHLKHQPHIHSSASKNPNHNTMTTTASTNLYEQACIAAENANKKRFNAAKLSVPDELQWYNDNTNWDALSRKEFREIMILMETVTVQFYNDTTGRCTYPSRHVAIKQFWADEWGCEYLPESGLWLDLATNTVIKSETEKKAQRDAKKAITKAEKKALKEALHNQYNDEEEEVYVQAAQKQQQPQTYRSRFDAEEEAYEKAYAGAQSAQSQSQKAQSEAQTQKAQKALEDQVKQQNQKQQQQAYDAWFDAEEEAYAEAYAQARLQEEQKAQEQKAQEQKAQEQKAQDEAQAYLDSFTYSDEEPTTRVSCQAVLYIEELTETKGDPDWRAYIYYDARIRRYVFKGTRRSLRATSKKTVFPEIKLCFRSSRELAHYLCSSTDSLLNVSLFAMASATVRDATFAQLYALPARGCKTELFGYDETRPRYSTFVNYLCMVRDIDATHSTFAPF